VHTQQLEKAGRRCRRFFESKTAESCFRLNKNFRKNAKKANLFLFERDTYAIPAMETRNSPAKSRPDELLTQTSGNEYVGYWC
jgi:hypothetical protein